jgi:hypothetical protein
MIQREYDGLKLKRTYFGGSKKKEFEIFKKTQNAGGECDWIEYKRILFPYFEDILHVYFSRAFITKILSVVLLGISMFFCVAELHMVSFTILMFSIFSRILFINYERKTKQVLNSYNLSHDVVKNEIKNQTGLEI